MHRWYTLRTTSANAIELAEQIQNQGLRAFVPTEYRPTMVGKEKVWQQQPSQSDLLFVYGSYDNIHNIIALYILNIHINNTIFNIKYSFRLSYI